MCTVNESLVQRRSCWYSRPFSWVALGILLLTLLTCASWQDSMANSLPNLRSTSATFHHGGASNHRQLNNYSPEIYNFVDFFKEIDNVYIVPIAVLAIVYAALCAKVSDSWKPMFACPDIVIDMSSAVINCYFGGSRAVAFATGNILHAVVAPLTRMSGKDDDGYDDGYKCVMIFYLISEIIEQATICSALEGSTRVAAFSSASLIILVFSCLSMAGDRKGSQMFGIWGMQLSFVAVVVCASFNDIRALLWLLPEIPFETFTPCY